MKQVVFYSGPMRGFVVAMLLPSAAIADDETKRLELTFAAGVQSSLVERDFSDDIYVGGVIDVQLLYRSRPFFAVGPFVSVWSFAGNQFDPETGNEEEFRDVFFDVGLRAAFTHEAFEAGPGFAFERDVSGTTQNFTQIQGHASYVIDRLILSTMVGWSSAVGDDDDIMFVGRFLFGVRL